MEGQILQRLRPDASSLLTAENILQSIPDTIHAFEEKLDRDVNLEPLNEVMAQVQQHDRLESDAWLAPRLHATLRLFRREAADPGIWLFLAARYPEYIRWRWQDKQGRISEERIVGATNRQAFARLWWGAEVSRNGRDYGPTELLFASQEMVNWVLDTQAFQNRPAAIAFIEHLGKDAPDLRIRSAAKALRHALTTVALDALAPDEGPNMIAIEAWTKELPDVTLMFGDHVPVGPEEGEVPTERIDAVKRILERVAPSSAIGPDQNRAA